MTSIYERKDGRFSVHFKDPREKNTSKLSETWSFHNDRKDAVEFAREKDCEFYNDKRYLLPKGITLDYAGRRFRLNVRINNQRTKHIITSHSLREVVDVRRHLINNLLDTI